MSKQSQSHEMQVKMAAGKAPSTSAIIDFVQQYKVTDGKGFKLSDYDPGDTAHLDNQSKEEARDLLQKGIEKLSALQEKLYAQDEWAVLLIFQAMDAAGKDGTIKHVMSGINDIQAEGQYGAINIMIPARNFRHIRIQANTQ